MLYNDDICIVDEIRVDNTVVLTALNTDVTSIDGDQVSVDEITPIPLTAEILEKNFLTQRGEWTEPVLYFFGDDYIEIYIKEYTEGIWEVVIDEVEMSCLPSWRMYVSNVHQLQHALRLCNIDKEI